MNTVNIDYTVMLNRKLNPRDIDKIFNNSFIIVEYCNVPSLRRQSRGMDSKFFDPQISFSSPKFEGFIPNIIDHSIFYKFSFFDEENKNIYFKSTIPKRDMNSMNVKSLLDYGLKLNIKLDERMTKHQIIKNFWFQCHWCLNIETGKIHRKITHSYLPDSFDKTFTDKSNIAFIMF